MDNIITFLGKKDEIFENKINDKVNNLYESGKINSDEVENIDKLQLAKLNKDIKITKDELRYIQRLCQTYDNDIRILNITSHRKYIGKYIVFVKKIILKVISFSLKNFIRQQEEFNTYTIKSLISLYNKK